MTIAAGFRCSDGIVLCADSEYTEGGLLKFTGSKFSVLNGFDCNLVTVFSGDQDFATMGSDEIQAGVLKSGMTAEDVLPIIKSVIERLHKKHMYQHPRAGYAEGPEVYFLIGLWTKKDGFELWTTSRTTVTRVPQWHTIGAGHYLAAYLGKTLLMDPVNVSEAALLGSYLLTQAKEHVPGCGGNTTIVTLTKEGEIKTESNLYDSERQIFFDDFEKMVKCFFYTLGNLDLPIDEFNRTLESTIQKSKNLRQERIQFKQMRERDEELERKIRSRNLQS